MKQRYTLTLSSIRGLRQFSLTLDMWRWLLGALLGFLLLWVLGAVALYYLHQKVDVLDWQKQAAEQSLQTLSQRNQDLEVDLTRSQAQVDSFEARLADMSQSLSAVEELLNLPVEATPSIPEDRVARVQQSLAEKQLLLQLIPSEYPVREYKGISSQFGWRTDPLNASKKQYHKGVDFRGQEGEDVLAAADGVVEFAADTDKGFGKVVIIMHNLGFKTLYAHLHTIEVKRGQSVNKGNKIATLGSTGRSTGPHLHYEVIYAGKNLNPAVFAQWNLEHYDELFKKERSVPWVSLVHQVERIANLTSAKPSSPVAAASVEISP